MATFKSFLDLGIWRVFPKRIMIALPYEFSDVT